MSKMSDGLRKKVRNLNSDKFRDARILSYSKFGNAAQVNAIVKAVNEMRTLVVDILKLEHI